MSASHVTRRIVVERWMMFLKLQNQGEANRHLGRSHGKNEQKHHLPVRLTPSGAGRNESEPAGIEHNLNAHQRKDEITPRE